MIVRMEAMADALAKAFADEGTDGNLYTGKGVPTGDAEKPGDHYLQLPSKNIYVANPGGGWRRLLWHEASPAQKQLLVLCDKRPADA